MPSLFPFLLPRRPCLFLLSRGWHAPFWSPDHVSAPLHSESVAPGATSIVPHESQRDRSWTGVEIRRLRKTKERPGVRSGREWELTFRSHAPAFSRRTHALTHSRPPSKFTAVTDRCLFRNCERMSRVDPSDIDASFSMTGFYLNFYYTWWIIRVPD